MLSRLKRCIVGSFVGAIALGWLLANVILDFVNIFATPVASWVQRGEFHGFSERTQIPTGFMVRDALPAAERFILLAVIWYGLFRWLYMSPQDNKGKEEMPRPMGPVEPE